MRISVGFVPWNGAKIRTNRARPPLFSNFFSIFLTLKKIEKNETRASRGLQVIFLYFSISLRFFTLPTPQRREKRPSTSISIFINFLF